MIYCRFSTDRQNIESLADQEAACRRKLSALGINDAEIQVIADAGMSAEDENRPGFNGVRCIVERSDCDLLIAEEVSRFFRHTTLAMQFIETAVDMGTRVITLNDGIDTSGDDWRTSSLFASVKGEWDNDGVPLRAVDEEPDGWFDGLPQDVSPSERAARVAMTKP